MLEDNRDIKIIRKQSLTDGRIEKKHEKFRILRQFRNSKSISENHNKILRSSDQSPKLECICYNKPSPHPTYAFSMYMLSDSEDTIVLLWSQALFVTCFWHSLSYDSEKENVKIIDKKNLKRRRQKMASHIIVGPTCVWLCKSWKKKSEFSSITGFPKRWDNA